MILTEAALTLFILSSFLSATESNGDEELAKIELLMRKPFSRAFDSAAEAVSVFDRFYGSASKERLAQLKSHTNDGIAIRAAWEQVRRTMKPHIDQTSTDPFSFEEGVLHRFVGFVEGRLRLELPRSWQRELVAARYYGRRHLAIPTKLDDEPYVWSEAGWARPPHLGLRKTQTGLQVVSEQGTCNIRAETIAKARADYSAIIENLNILMVSDRRCIVALHDDLWTPYPIYCLEPRSGDIVWQSEVWAEVPVIRGVSGPTPHWIDIRRCGNRVYIFGTCLFSMYIEAFALDDGDNEVRFSTSY